MTVSVGVQGHHSFITLIVITSAIPMKEEMPNKECRDLGRVSLLAHHRTRLSFIVI